MNLRHRILPTDAPSGRELVVDGRNAPSPSDRVADALQCAHGGATAVLVTDRTVKVDGGLRIAYYIGADATARASQGMTGCYCLRGSE